jgi:hypothetical protein
MNTIINCQMLKPTATHIYKNWSIYDSYFLVCYNEKRKDKSLYKETLFPTVSLHIVTKTRNYYLWS